MTKAPSSADNHTTDTVEMRRSHIKHEASVRSVGVLYYLGALFIIIAGIAGVLTDTESTMVVRIVVAAALIGLGVFQFWVGTGLRELKAWARVPTGILSGIGLLGFPIGTLINGYILFLVFSKKGTVVFSPEYKDAIAATPEVKYKTSIIVWIFVGLLILVLGLGLLASLLSR
ncbi:MAG: hypothetical protein H7A43_04020 [Verrucomicrobia bacterium]|nr:hypothetical protein [Verrucomicrobiota bacterium]